MPSTQVKIDIDVDCPLKSRLDSTFTLRVEIPKQAIGTDSPIDCKLWVHISASSFDILDGQRKFIQLPMLVDLARLEFELVPRQLGKQIIEILYFLNGQRVAYLLAETEVSK